MQNGISVYAGLGYDIENIVRVIEKSAELGLKKIFTSSQIPEVESEKFFEDFAKIVSTAISHDFEIILDVNPNNFSAFDFEGLTLRLDDGFTAAQIVELSLMRKIQLNASTITNEFLTVLLNLGANFKNISALHNFYPHPLTGLDVEFFESQNKILHDFGISVGAFVASRDGVKRPPLGEGLPTLEDCRNFSVDLAARFLAALGTDFIIIADGLPTDEECSALAKISGNEVIMQAKFLTDDNTTQEILKNSFTRRPDVSKYVIRAIEGREFFKSTGGSIQPNNTVERNFGDVTIDNENFGRYCGEIQIVKEKIFSDLRVNVVAHILDEEIFLVNYIKPSQKFSFRFI